MKTKKPQCIIIIMISWRYSEKALSVAWYDIMMINRKGSYVWLKWIHTSTFVPELKKSKQFDAESDDDRKSFQQGACWPLLLALTDYERYSIHRPHISFQREMQIAIGLLLKNEQTWMERSLLNAMTGKTTKPQPLRELKLRV